MKGIRESKFKGTNVGLYFPIVRNKPPFITLEQKENSDLEMVGDTLEEMSVKPNEGIILKDGVNTNRLDLTLTLIRVIKDMGSRISSDLKRRYKLDNRDKKRRRYECGHETHAFHQ